MKNLDWQICVFDAVLKKKILILTGVPALFRPLYINFSMGVIDTLSSYL